MKPRVCVCQPIYGQVPAEAAASFARMLVQGSVMGLIGGLYQNTYSLLGTARNEMVKQALATDCTHLFFVDSDMVLLHGALPKLLSDNVPVVSGLYFQRNPPFYPVVHDRITLKPVSTYPPGLSKGYLIGLGCALIKMNVFRAIEDYYQDQSWFQFDGKVGEDIFFCGRVSAALDDSCYLDADVRCGHIAQIEITEDHFKRHQSGDKTFL